MIWIDKKDHTFEEIIGYINTYIGKIGKLELFAGENIDISKDFYDFFDCQGPEREKIDKFIEDKANEILNKVRSNPTYTNYLGLWVQLKKILNEYYGIPNRYLDDINLSSDQTPTEWQETIVKKIMEGFNNSCQYFLAEGKIENPLNHTRIFWDFDLYYYAFKLLKENIPFNKYFKDYVAIPLGSLYQHEAELSCIPPDYRRDGYFVGLFLADGIEYYGKASNITRGRSNEIYITLLDSVYEIMSSILKKIGLPDEFIFEILKKVTYRNRVFEIINQFASKADSEDTWLDSILDVGEQKNTVSECKWQKLLESLQANKDKIITELLELANQIIEDDKSLLEKISRYREVLQPKTPDEKRILEILNNKNVFREVATDGIDEIIRLVPIIDLASRAISDHMKFINRFFGVTTENVDRNLLSLYHRRLPEILSIINFKSFMAEYCIQEGHRNPFATIRGLMPYLNEENRLMWKCYPKKDIVPTLKINTSLVVGLTDPYVLSQDISKYIEAEEEIRPIDAIPSCNSGYSVTNYLEGLALTVSDGDTLGPLGVCESPYTHVKNWRVDAYTIYNLIAQLFEKLPEFLKINPRLFEILTNRINYRAQIYKLLNTITIDIDDLAKRIISAIQEKESVAKVEIGCNDSTSGEFISLFNRPFNEYSTEKENHVSIIGALKVRIEVSTDWIRKRINPLLEELGSDAGISKITESFNPKFYSLESLSLNQESNWAICEGKPNPQKYTGIDLIRLVEEFKIKQASSGIEHTIYDVALEFLEAILDKYKIKETIVTMARDYYSKINSTFKDLNGRLDALQDHRKSIKSDNDELVSSLKPYDTPITEKDWQKIIYIPSPFYYPGGIKAFYTFKDRLEIAKEYSQQAGTTLNYPLPDIEESIQTYLATYTIDEETRKKHMAFLKDYNLLRQKVANIVLHIKKAEKGKTMFSSLEASEFCSNHCNGYQGLNTIWQNILQTFSEIVNFNGHIFSVDIQWNIDSSQSESEISVESLLVGLKGILDNYKNDFDCVFDGGQFYNTVRNYYNNLLNEYNKTKEYIQPDDLLLARKNFISLFINTDYLGWLQQEINNIEKRINPFMMAKEIFEKESEISLDVAEPHQPDEAGKSLGEKKASMRFHPLGQDATKPLS